MVLFEGFFFNPWQPLISLHTLLTFLDFCDLDVWFRGDIVGRNKMLVILKNERANEMKTQYVWKCETNFEEIERVHVDLNYFI